MCSRDCNDDEFVFTADCICKNCSELTPNCIQCSATKCKKCSGGYGLVNNKCEKCSAGYYSSAGASSCTACSSGYKVENGKCVEDTWCKGDKMIKISSSLCMTKYNLGNGNIPLNNTDSRGLCWTAQNPNCTSINGYSGCNRYLCNWYASNSACDNLIIDGHSNWRLPTEAELTTAMPIAGAMFCSETSSSTYALCISSGSYCDGAAHDNVCYASHAWTNTIVDIYCGHCELLGNGEVVCLSNVTSVCSKHPMGTRCVHAL